MMRLAVFGAPILHSKSPQLFNAAFDALAMEAAYTRIRPSNVSDIHRIILSANLKGGNITTPYKADLIPFLDWISEEAVAIGGVNTVVNSEGHLLGYNTDYLGVLGVLDELSIPLSSETCLVLGAGPAAAAAVYALSHVAATVVVANRTYARAQLLAQKFGCTAVPFSALPSWISRSALTVSTLLPHAALPSGVEFPEHAVLLDANYRRSVVAEQAARNGCKIVSGERWLLHQAVSAFSCFFGSKPNLAIMESGLKTGPSADSVRAVSFVDYLKDKHYRADLVISAQNQTEYTGILNEEIDSAFEG